MQAKHGAEVLIVAKGSGRGLAGAAPSGAGEFPSAGVVSETRRVSVRQKSEVAPCGSAQAVSAIKGQRAGGPGCGGRGARWRC
ncbi:hypothetical protein CBM2615_A120167 [Cupriavidus taiwanensis]|uniref:Uncharacterized protein n=1 Tax=Cupriavidus taiwanensis TaxID=164546 RepID=A0A976G0B9_9BURK|nr:hypothetical protein CBM2615_A120167 [Cupriavidus taiwanensis]SOZ49421.1 hypothetical protein CBM2614_A120164 [Cupriavidus taiwanensis]SOZ52011.1 hypothetical protein CBM2613_A110166 [Cupriavidus taiwanensis]